jgi:hypothetical protein
MVVADSNERTNLLTFAFTVAVFTAAGLLVWLILLRIGLEPAGSAYAAGGLLFACTTIGRFIGLDDVDRILVLALPVLVASLAYRLRRHGLFRGLMAWLAVFVLAYPLAIIVSKPLFAGSLHVDTSTDIAVPDFATKPDLLVLVVDGYGGKDVLREFYGYDNSEILRELEQRGFVAPGAIRANYGRTQLAIPTVLQLDYVATEGELTDADLRSLLDVLGGDSRISNALRSQGYRTVQVESGWLGSRCGSGVDLCIRSPWPDETFYDAANRSVLEGLPGFEQGRPFTIGALHATDWLINEMPSLLNDDQPDFIFAHVLLPHPPLFLDRHCQPDFRGGSDGFAVGEMGISQAELASVRALYLQQVECANHVLLDVADSLGQDDFALIFGDHGPDSQGQLFMQSEDWTAEQFAERFQAFFAGKAPGCDLTGLGSLVNAGRRVVSCLSGNLLPDLPTRSFDIHKAVDRNTVVELEVPSDPLFEVTG